MTLFNKYSAQIKHTALALGAGLGAFLVSVQATVALSPYAKAAADGAIVALIGLGVGVAKRSSP
ncbi:MAG: hypothetical protein OEV29_11875 [Thermoleophilia bacterium]|nr:hypothetical protein [Thermoleophilia bacterium]